MTILVVKSTPSQIDAEEVLKSNGFQIIRSYNFDNLFEKGGELFKISHPVWEMNESKSKFIGVRLEKYSLPI